MTIMPKHVFLLLFTFWSFWLYTEVTEYLARDTFNSEVKTFMFEGGRNTNDMGKELCERVTHLEAEHHSSPPLRSCAEIYSRQTRTHSHD